MSDTYQGDTGYSRGPGSYTQDRTQPYNVVNWIGGQTSKDHYAGAYRKPGMPPVPPEARPYVPPRKVSVAAGRSTAAAAQQLCAAVWVGPSHLAGRADWQ